MRPEQEAGADRDGTPDQDVLDPHDGDPPPFAEQVEQDDDHDGERGLTEDK